MSGVHTIVFYEGLLLLANASIPVKSRALILTVNDLPQSVFHSRRT